MEVGDELEPERRTAPDAAGVGRYVSNSDIVESLFIDVDYARARGFRGIVVPGPMLTAFIEQYLRRAWRGWRLEVLSTTFRMPTIAGDRLVFRGALTELHTRADGDHAVCEAWIEHDSGERAVIGTATLRRESPVT